MAATTARPTATEPVPATGPVTAAGPVTATGPVPATGPVAARPDFGHRAATTAAGQLGTRGARTTSSTTPLRPTPARIACWQAIVVLGAGGTIAGTRWAIPAALLAGATAAVPVRGSWLSTLLARWVRLQLRRTRPPHALPTAATADIGGERIGVVARPDALVVVLRASRADLAALVAAAHAYADDPRCEFRIVRWHRPRPRTWLVVRARRDADSPDDDTLRVALGNVLRRLRRSGLGVTPLSAAAINATTVDRAGAGRESWRAGPTGHIGLRVTAPGAAPLQRLLLAAGDADLTVTVRDGRLAGVLLVGTDATAGRLGALAPGLGIRLERLDGRHGPAGTASLPIGGTLP